MNRLKQRTISSTIGACAAALILALVSSARGADVFVSRFGLGEIDEISNGVTTTYATGLALPTSLVFDPAGNLYVANVDQLARTGFATIVKIAPDGAQTTYATGFSQPTALTFDKNLNLYVADESAEKVYKVTPAGNVSTYASIAGEPEGLAFDSLGNLFVDALGAKIFEVSPAGVVSPFVDLHRPNSDSLAIDSADNLYINDDFTHIFQITPAGSSSFFATASDRNFSMLSSMAFDHSGNLLAIDNGLHELVSFSPSGAETVLASLGGNTTGLAVPVPEPSGLLMAAIGIVILAALAVRGIAPTAEGVKSSST